MEQRGYHGAAQMSRRRDGYLRRRFVIISTIPMAIAKIGCGPSNFHLQAILWEMIKCIREWSTRLMVQSAVFLVVRTLGSLRWWRMLRTFCCGGKTDWSTFSWGTTWYQLYAFAMHFPFLHRSLSRVSQNKAWRSSKAIVELRGWRGRDIGCLNFGRNLCRGLKNT